VILALDTDVVVSWLMAGNPRHAVARSVVERELRRSGGAIALVPHFNTRRKVTTLARLFVAGRVWPPAGDKPRALSIIPRQRRGRARRASDEHTRQFPESAEVVPQTLHEVLHVATDPRRFERPLPMKEALRLVRLLWEARDVVRVQPGPHTLLRTLELMERHRLGRKRILDTALAATLEGAEVRRLATFNGDDFRVFPFLDVVEPR
jgi:predicted nucleic acid-binding protein